MELLSIVIGAVIVYFIIMVVLHKLFEKFFMMLLFGVSTLFVITLIYFMLKGV